MLVSYTEKPVDGSAPFYPMSEKPMGIIMYTPDGFMSAQLTHPDRKSFVSGDWSMVLMKNINRKHHFTLHTLVPFM
jgi:hypothetical protein